MISNQDLNYAFITTLLYESSLSYRVVFALLKVLCKFQIPAWREHTDQLIRQVVRSVLETPTVQRELTPALLVTQDSRLTLRKLSVVRTAKRDINTKLGCCEKMTTKTEF